MAGLRFQKLLFCSLGVTVSVLFAIQAVWVFSNPPSANAKLWKCFHWLGQALLCVLAGAEGCYLEVKGGRALLEAQFTRFAANRLLLSFFYFWMGCYIVDLGEYGERQIYLARATGLLSCVVAVGNLVTACACEAAAAKELGTEPRTEVVPGQPHIPVDVPGKAADLEAGAAEPAASTVPAPAQW